MGVGSSRMSGVNNVALWTGIKASPCTFYKYSSVIGLDQWCFSYFSYNCWCYRRYWTDLKIKQQKDDQGNTVLDSDGEPVLQQEYSVETGTVLTINTKDKAL